MPNQYCHLGDIFGQGSPNFHDPYYTVLPYCMIRNVSLVDAKEVGT